MKYLDYLKAEYVRETVIGGKKFKFSAYGFNNAKKINDFVSIIADSLISVDDIELNSFEEIKKDIAIGISDFEARKKEIQTWDNSLVKLLAVAIISEKYDKDKKKDIDFDKYPFYRLYWKMCRMFGIAEVDKWGDLEWNWALYNFEKDLKEQEQERDFEFERLKPWRNLELYKAEQKQKENEKNMEMSNISLAKQYLKDSFNFDGDIEIVEEDI